MPTSVNHLPCAFPNQLKKQYKSKDEKQYQNLNEKGRNAFYYLDQNAVIQSNQGIPGGFVLKVEFLVCLKKGVSSQHLFSTLYFIYTYMYKLLHENLIPALLKIFSPGMVKNKGKLKQLFLLLILKHKLAKRVCVCLKIMLCKEYLKGHRHSFLGTS